MNFDVAAFASRPAIDHREAPRFAGLSMLYLVPLAALAVHQLPGLPSVWVPVALSLALFACRLVLTTMKHRKFRGRLRAWAGLSGFFFCCVSYIVWQADRALSDRLPAALEGHDMMVEGRVSGLARPFSAGVGFDFVIESCAMPHEWCGRTHRLRLGWYGGAGQQVNLTPGDRWRLTVRLKRPHAPVNPGGFDAELNALASATAARGYVRAATKSKPLRKPNARLGPASQWRLLDKVDQARTRVSHAMSSALADWPDKVRGTLVALVTGDQQAIPSVGWQEFNRTGTSHLMSISGLHVTMFAALATACLRMLLRWPLFPSRCLLWCPAPVALVVGGATAAFGYTLFSGWGIPAQRTSLMLAVAGLALLSGRAGNIAAVMAVAAAVVVLADPWAPMVAGFWLSFVAVAAIVLYGQSAGSAAERVLVAATRTQWAATVSLIPLGAVWFGTFSLVSPLANAVAIPVISVLITPAALFGAVLQLIWPWAGSMVLQLTARPAQWLLDGLSWASSLHHAVLVVGQPDAWVLSIAGLGCWVLLAPARPVPRWWGGLLLLPLLTLPQPGPREGGFRLLALDIGQGNAVLIETRHHALLFDTGPTYGGGSGAGDRIVTPALQARRIAKLDALVVSHRDLDHAGGAVAVLSAFQVRKLYSSVGPSHPLRQQAADFTPCRRGQQWTWDGVEFAFLHPGVASATGLLAPQPRTGADRAKKVRRRQSSPNARSCVLRIRSPGGSALLTGDIERAQEQQLISVLGPAALQADVLMAPHHGSNTSSSPAFIAAVNPFDVFFQVGYRNRFRHPAAKVQARYERRNIAALRTDESGALEWRFEPGASPRLIRYRQARPRYWRIQVNGQAGARPG